MVPVLTNFAWQFPYAEADRFHDVAVQVFDGEIYVAWNPDVAPFPPQR
jgi:hypothetical protein